MIMMYFYTGPGKTPVELREVIRSGIRFINVESVVEAIRINEIAEIEGIDKVDVLLRGKYKLFLRWCI